MYDMKGPGFLVFFTNTCIWLSKR